MRSTRGPRAKCERETSAKRTQNERKMRARTARGNETNASFRKGCDHMEHIVRIDGEKVFISDGSGNLSEAPLSAVQYEDPREGDPVRLFETDSGVLVSKAEDEPLDAYPAYGAQTGAGGGQYGDQYGSGTANGTGGQRTGGAMRKCNKHVFVWLFAFVLGEFGVDRFYRGQIGLGILKFITAGGLGMWFLADFIIAAIKAYSNSAFGPDEDVIFINGHYAK